MCRGFDLFALFALFGPVGLDVETHRCRWASLQLLDLVVYYEVYKSHLENRRTNRLRWLHSMEATLEAAPQIVLQIIYLLTEGERSGHATTVTIGLLFSILKLGVTAINSDESAVTDAAKGRCTRKYWIRSFFRFSEITSRVFIYVLIWVTMGLFWLGLLILFHVINNLVLYHGGVLGRERWNVVGFIVYFPKLSQVLQEGKSHTFFRSSGKLEKPPSMRIAEAQYRLFWVEKEVADREAGLVKRGVTRMLSARSLEKVATDRSDRSDRVTRLDSIGSMDRMDRMDSARPSSPTGRELKELNKHSALDEFEKVETIARKQVEKFVGHEPRMQKEFKMNVLSADKNVVWGPFQWLQTLLVRYVKFFFYFIHVHTNCILLLFCCFVVFWAWGLDWFGLLWTGLEWIAVC